MSNPEEMKIRCIFMRIREGNKIHAMRSPSFPSMAVLHLHWDAALRPSTTQHLTSS